MASNGSSKGGSEGKGAVLQLPIVGARGELCEQCGAPLAIDQRYCLNCGERRAGPRADFRRHLEGRGREAHPAPAPGPARSRDWGAWPAAFAVAALGGMLLIGVLIGRSGDDPVQQAAAPVVVQGGEAGTSAGASDSPSAKSATNQPSEAREQQQEPQKKAGGRGGGEVVDVGNAKTLSTDDLNALENCTGAECNEIGDQLGDTIATPGKAPPKDNKAPGGGSGGAVVIK
jgi:hypothetical protein